MPCITFMMFAIAEEAFITHRVSVSGINITEKKYETNCVFRVNWIDSQVASRNLVYYEKGLVPDLLLVYNREDYASASLCSTVYDYALMYNMRLISREFLEQCHFIIFPIKLDKTNHNTIGIYLKVKLCWGRVSSLLACV